VDRLTGSSPSNDHWVRGLAFAGQELVQTTSVGWKEEQKPVAFAYPFNDLSSLNLLASMLFVL
jgi:hypothetical protein